MISSLFNVKKTADALKQVTSDLATVTADRDAVVAKLAEFEATHKDYIESAQTADQMKAAHQTELETLKAEYETKLTAKDVELATVKEKASKEISVTKESVAAETIAIVASQVTSAPIESVVKTDNTQLKTKSGKSYKVISRLNK
jgi:hypothetical protein